MGFLTAFSPDGALVAATDPGDDIDLWDTRTRQRRLVLRRYHRAFDPSGQGLVPYSLSDAVISPDGGFLAALGQDRDSRGKNVRFLKLWSIGDPGRRRRRLVERTSATALSRWHVAFAADGRTLASTFAGRLRLWDTASLTPTDLGDPGEDAILEFAAAGALLAEAGRFRLRLWDTAAGRGRRRRAEDQNGPRRHLRRRLLPGRQPDRDRRGQRRARLARARRHSRARKSKSVISNGPRFHPLARPKTALTGQAGRSERRRQATRNRAASDSLSVSPSPGRVGSGRIEPPFGLSAPSKSIDSIRA